MAVHVAVLKPVPLKLILDGRKIIESRLTRQSRPPFGRIKPGERIYIKQSGGLFAAVAVAHRVWMADDLTPADVDQIAKTHNRHICGPPDYWHEKRTNSRYATLIWLRDVQPTTQHPRYRPQNMRAWYTLDDAADPIAASLTAARNRSWQTPITPGCLTQGYLKLTACLDRFPADSLGGPSNARATRRLKLHLAQGPTIETDIVRSARIFRWRGWKPWLKQHRLRPGDAVRFTPIAKHAYRVEPVKRR